MDVVDCTKPLNDLLELLFFALCCSGRDFFHPS